MERKRNDPLRELLEFVKAQILSAHPDTQQLDGIAGLIEPLTIAIQDLEQNPGPSQGPTG
jgi:hypothetical protein